MRPRRCGLSIGTPLCTANSTTARFSAAVVIGVTVFGERIGGREIAGLILIVGAVTLVVGGDSVSQRLLRFRKMFPRKKDGKK